MHPRRTWRRHTFAGLALFATACRPDFPERPSEIETRRVVAIVSTPAEVRPGESVTYRTFVASPSGPVEDTSLEWAFCATPRRITENGSVSPACAKDGVLALPGSANETTATIPTNACALFGPETPPGDFRPRDPDTTGGFYQPVRVRTTDAMAFGATRIRCNLANAPGDAVAVYGSTYRANTNPVLTAVTLDTGDASPNVRVGRRVVVRASWSEASKETYAFYDPATTRVVARKEALHVSWYATAGAFEFERTGREEDELETYADDPWTAPEAPTRVHIWAVLRDDRGGMDVRTMTLDVTP